MARQWASAVCAVILCFAYVDAAGKKPLFEWDDHYVMLNDYDRNNFYRRALERLVPECGPDCSVLDVGAGSGLLSMMAASYGAPSVLAIEANPDLADLARRTIARNTHNFPKSNVTVVAELSSRVDIGRMPQARPADILVTETFGTMLLGEGAINFVPDARDRLLKKGGIVIPAGGCQYVTLVESPEQYQMSSTKEWNGFNMSRLDMLQDTVYWKATMGASRIPMTPLADRICVLEIDMYKDTKEAVPENRTFTVKATRDGTIHSALFDWDIWADKDRKDILSTAPGSRGFAGDVAWGWLMQVQEEVGEDWKYGPGRPKSLVVKKGDSIDVGVEYIAKGISLHARVRKTPPPSSPHANADPVGSPTRMHGIQRGDILEANEFYLPVAGDSERHYFYEAALNSVIKLYEGNESKPTVLDVSSGAGIPSLLAAKQGLHVLALTHRAEFSKALRDMAVDNGVETFLESYAAEPRDMLDSLLPLGERVDIVVVDPPGTPLHGRNPFALLPSIRKHLLKDGGKITPAGACYEVGLVESDDLSSMYSVPGGKWWKLDLTIWNEEANRQNITEKMVPYTKWFAKHTTMKYKWLSEPVCVFSVDLDQYGVLKPDPETVNSFSLPVAHSGRAHALVARWSAWAEQGDRSRRLGADSNYYGRGLTWPHYVQPIAEPGRGPGLVEPVVVAAGEGWPLEVTVRQGASKVTGGAGPEFTLRLGDRQASPSAPSPGGSEL